MQVSHLRPVFSIHMACVFSTRDMTGHHPHNHHNIHLHNQHQRTGLQWGALFEPNQWNVFHWEGSKSPLAIIMMITMRCYEWWSWLVMHARTHNEYLLLFTISFMVVYPIDARYINFMAQMKPLLHFLSPACFYTQASIIPGFSSIPSDPGHGIKVGIVKRNHPPVWWWLSSDQDDHKDT